MRKKFILNFAGIDFQIECETPLFEAFSYIYQHLQKKTSNQVSASLQFFGNGAIQIEAKDRTDHLPVEINVDPSQHGSILTILLLKLSANMNDHLIFMHGNAMLFDEKVFYFFGNSGVGKSTLTQEAINQTNGVSICEDLIIIDTEKTKVYPYPRAFGSRDSEARDVIKIHDKYWKAHPGINESDIKKFHDSSESYFIFLKGNKVNQTERTDLKDQISTWVTSSEKINAEDLKNAKLPVEDIKEHSHLYQITYKAELNREQRLVEERILAEANAIILHTSSSQDNLTDQFERPESPEVKEMDSGEFAEAINSQMISPSMKYNQTPTGLRLFQIIQIFDGPAYEVIPGGLPKETITEIMKVINS